MPLQSLMLSMRDGLPHMMTAQSMLHKDTRKKVTRENQCNTIKFGWSTWPGPDPHADKRMGKRMNQVDRSKNQLGEGRDEGRKGGKKAGLWVNG